MTTNLADLIRNIPDFPIPGIQFKDITPLLRDGEALRQAIDAMAVRYADAPSMPSSALSRAGSSSAHHSRIALV
jgi:adenine phosphoribosyltransferase (EC 2.4.2.7)